MADGDADRESASYLQESDDQSLRERVAALEARQERSVADLYRTLRGLGLSDDAIEKNVSRLTGRGLTRRAALLATLGAVGGAGFMSGRVSAQASTSDSDGDVGTPSDPVDVFADGVDATSVSTDQASIINETLINAKTDASVSIGSANTWTSPSYGTVNKDERNEFSSDQFTPDQTGWYLISANAKFTGVSDGDFVQARLRNATDGTTAVVVPGLSSGSSGNVGPPPLVVVEQLTAGKSYEAQFRNAGSATNLDSGNGIFYARGMFR